MRELSIDFETADKITLLNLQDYRTVLKNELDKYLTGQWLHPDDVAKNARTIEALNIIIRDFGGE